MNRKERALKYANEMHEDEIHNGSISIEEYQTTVACFETGWVEGYAEAKQEMSWQPISTAPKHNVLTINKRGQCRTGRVSVLTMLGDEIVGWMELPAPPAKRNDEGSVG